MAQQCAVGKRVLYGFALNKDKKKNGKSSAEQKKSVWK